MPVAKYGKNYDVSNVKDNIYKSKDFFSFQDTSFFVLTSLWQNYAVYSI